jgi:hypothetical protein
MSCILVGSEEVMVTVLCNACATNNLHMFANVKSCMKKRYYEYQYYENKQCSKTKLMFSN